MFQARFIAVPVLIKIVFVSPRLLVWTWTSVNAKVQATIKAFVIFRLTYAAGNLATANRKLSIIISKKNSGIISRTVAEGAATVLNATSIIGESSLSYLRSTKGGPMPLTYNMFLIICLLPFLSLSPSFLVEIIVASTTIISEISVADPISTASRITTTTIVIRTETRSAEEIGTIAEDRVLSRALPEAIRDSGNSHPRKKNQKMAGRLSSHVNLVIHAGKNLHNSRSTATEVATVANGISKAATLPLIILSRYHEMNASSWSSLVRWEAFRYHSKTNLKIFCI